MRVFILSTGRNGSTTIARACHHITNYSSGHETLTKKFGKERFQYPQNHIESDNRLSWHLGQLDLLFGDEAFYVHLKRERDAVAKSHMSRYYKKYSIIEAFCEGIRLTPTIKLNEEQKLQACYDYIDTVNINIDSFLANKTKTMEMNLENLEEDFRVFWNKIGAEGDFEKAIQDIKTRHNATEQSGFKEVITRYKMMVLHEFKYVKHHIFKKS